MEALTPLSISTACTRSRHDSSEGGLMVRCE